MFFRPSPPEPKALRLIGDCIDILVVALGTGMIALMSLNVFARTTSLIDLAANVELGELLMVWATFLGGASAARRVSHMRVSEIVEALPPRLSAWLDQATRLLSLLLLGLIVWKGANIVSVTWSQTSSVLYWPIGLTYLAMPVGGALCMIYIAYQVIRPPARTQPLDVI